MKKPTQAQMKVLEAMRDGTVLVRGHVNHIRWYLQGSGAPVKQMTADALSYHGWIDCADRSGVYRHYTLTDAGRTALNDQREES